MKRFRDAAALLIFVLLVLSIKVTPVDAVGGLATPAEAAPAAAGPAGPAIPAATPPAAAVAPPGGRSLPGRLLVLDEPGAGPGVVILKTDRETAAGSGHERVRECHAEVRHDRGTLVTHTRC